MSINPYCPHCSVRHDALKIYRCRELAEEDEACDQERAFGSCAACGVNPAPRATSPAPTANGAS